MTTILIAVGAFVGGAVFHKFAAAAWAKGVAWAKAEATKKAAGKK